MGHSPEPPHLASEKPAGTAGRPAEDNGCRLPARKRKNSVFCQDDIRARISRCDAQSNTNTLMVMRVSPGVKRTVGKSIVSVEFIFGLERKLSAAHK